MPEQPDSSFKGESENGVLMSHNVLMKCRW